MVTNLRRMQLRFDLIKAVKILTVVFWVVPLCSPVGGYKRFDGTYFVLMTEVMLSSETLVIIYKTTRSHKPQYHDRLSTGTLDNPDSSDVMLRLLRNEMNAVPGRVLPACLGSDLKNGNGEVIGHLGENVRWTGRHTTQSQQLIALIPMLREEPVYKVTN
jgi:hypothetical protein